jgi:hypothetical protein
MGVKDDDTYTKKLTYILKYQIRLSFSYLYLCLVELNYVVYEPETEQFYSQSSQENMVKVCSC